MTDRSFEVWKSWKEAQLKYDYFFVGLTAALFAYIGGKYVPEQLSFSQNSFELLALVLLVVSLVAGIKRLEIDLLLQSLDVQKHVAIDRRDLGNKILNVPGDVIASETRTSIDKEGVKETLELINEFITKAEKGFEIEAKRNRIIFALRNWALVIGFIVLAISKFIGVYGATVNI